jgi:ATP-dependent DNA ligase
MPKSRRSDTGLEIPAGLQPMEAEPVDELPTGKGWLYEPKYDGFRCIAFRDGGSIRLQSRKQKPLQRFFPELAKALLELPVERFVLDGEIIIRGQPFEVLQLRLHPAASRIAKLAEQHPATFVAFDLLADSAGCSLIERPFGERRRALEAFRKDAGPSPTPLLSKATRSAAAARGWLNRAKGGLDGIMAKRLDLPYLPGARAMAKFKTWKTVDCVLGGVYRNENSGRIESLLLGLYDESGLLDYVGRVPVHKEADEIDRKLRPLIGGPGFTGRSPGGKNRWSGRERKPIPLRPVLVAEVSADHITGERMRHGARLLRWRDDKAPKDCTMEQIRH